MSRTPHMPVPGETVKGVVRDEAARQRAVDKIVRFCTENLHLESRGVLPAAIKGPKGNIEFLLHAAKPAEGCPAQPSLVDAAAVEAVVEGAHEALAR